MFEKKATMKDLLQLERHQETMRGFDKNSIRLLECKYNLLLAMHNRLLKHLGLEEVNQKSPIIRAKP